MILSKANPINLSMVSSFSLEGRIFRLYTLIVDGLAFFVKLLTLLLVLDMHACK